MKTRINYTTNKEKYLYEKELLNDKKNCEILKDTNK
jgi:hypothetical protein